MGAINEAQWKAAQPSIDKQAGAIVDSIIGDGASSAGASELPPGYGEAWENGTLFGNAGLGGIASSTDGSAATGDYSMIVTGDPSKGYPVPVGYTNDPAVIKALYANTVAYVNYENKQPLYDLPPVPGPDDPQALIDYNHELQHGLYPGDYGNTLSTINVVPTSEMQQDVAAANERQAETEQALSSWQGSFGGDLAYNAVTLLTRGGNDLIAGVESVKDVLTDGASAAQAVTGLGTALWDVGSAIAHPVNAYNQAVNDVSDWYGESPDQQAQDIGRFGIDTLLSFGAEGIAAKGLDYAGTLAGKLGAAWDTLNAGPAIGSPLAQTGKLDVAAFAATPAEATPIGLSTSRIVSPETVQRYLVEQLNWSEARATGYVDSFEGPITARISRPGEQFLRYLDGPDGTGNFLTSSEFFSPVDARRGLNLDPALTRNLATSRQVVVTQQSNIVFEGAVRGGTPGVQQTVLTDKSKFLFDPAYRYY